MDINLERKNKIIRDNELKEKFEEFSNGFFDDISMGLYELDGKYFLYLEPYTDKILSSNMCISASSKSELESIIENLTCNMGILLSEKSGKIQKAESSKQTVQIDEKKVSLVDFNQVYIEGKNANRELYKADELTEKIKSISPKVFGSDNNLDISSYAKNTMFTRANGRYTLDKEDFDLLKYYKEEGYEFLNSFLGNGELKTRGDIEKEHIGKKFIDNLYKIDKLFEKFPVLDESITVYRGMATQNSLSNIEYNSFVSTSLDRNIAKNNFSKGSLYQITLPKGTHYIPMDAINGFEGMYNEKEAEILLRPSSFSIVNGKMEGNTEVLNVKAQEKNNFSQIIREALERRKEELIKRGLCSEDEFKEVMKYVDEHDKENESKNSDKHIDEIISKLNSELEQLKQQYQQLEQRKKETKLNLSVMEIDVQLANLKCQIDATNFSIEDQKIRKKFKKNHEEIEEYKGKGNQEKNKKIMAEKRKIDAEKREHEIKSNLVYYEDEINKLEKSIALYEARGMQPIANKFKSKLKELQTEMEPALEDYKNLNAEKEAEKGHFFDHEDASLTDVYEDIIKDNNSSIIGARSTKCGIDKDGNQILNEYMKVEDDKRSITESVERRGKKQISTLNIAEKSDKSNKKLVLQDELDGKTNLTIFVNGKRSKTYIYREDGSLSIDAFDKNGQPVATYEYDNKGNCLIGPERRVIGTDGVIHISEDKTPIQNLSRDYVLEMYYKELENFNFDQRAFKKPTGQSLGKQTIEELKNYNVRKNVENFIDRESRIREEEERKQSEK